MGSPKPLICTYFTEHWYFNTHPLCVLWVHNFWKLEHLLSGIILSVGDSFWTIQSNEDGGAQLFFPPFQSSQQTTSVSDVLSCWECFNQPDFFFCSLCSLRTGDFMALLCCTMCTVITYAKSMPLMNEHCVCVSSRWECSFDLLRSTTVADGCLNCFINALKSSIISQTILME